MSTRRTAECLVGLGLFVTLASGSMPSEEEMAEARAEDQAFWTEKKSKLAAVHSAVAAVDIASMEARSCDSEALGAKLSPKLVDQEYGTVELSHATLDFLARFGSDDPAAFTADKSDFYWLTDMVTFTRMDELSADGSKPKESSWKWALEEMWERQYLVVFVVDQGAGNIAPVVHDEDDIDWGELTATAFVVELETAEIHCQGRFQAENSEEIEWVEGAVFSDGSAGEALRNDFADNVNDAVSPLVSKPLALDIGYWN